MKFKNKNDLNGWRGPISMTLFSLVLKMQTDHVYDDGLVIE